MAKRWRQPKAKPGELIARWGKMPGNNPDFCYAWGEGVNHCDGSLLHYMLGTQRQQLNLNAPLGASRFNWVTYAPSLIQELEARGYDITTLRFSVQKKKAGV